MIFDSCKVIEMEDHMTNSRLGNMSRMMLVKERLAPSDLKKLVQTMSQQSSRVKHTS